MSKFSKAGAVTRQVFVYCFLAASHTAIFPAARAGYFGNVQGGTDFPQGSASFADAVVDYAPGLVGANPTIPYRGAFNALGLPDYPGGVNAGSQQEASFVTLGTGGSIVLRFDDNKLTGSGDNSLDLWVFEVGPDVEDTFIDISPDGQIWYSVGKVFGNTSGIDIDAFGFTATDRFAFVRLTDDPNEGDQDGITVGADIDAVGAISTLLTSVPEPGTPAIVAASIAFAALVLVRKRQSRISAPSE
ncbi:MAG: PEP-CTERM sorting domain-containing protein [Planctomycetales bacterium]